MRAEAPPGARLVGMLAVTATYVSFLLHAQFGFLALVGERLGTGRDVERIMALMGGAGLLASFAAGALLRVVPSRRLVVAGLVGCGAVALASLACRTPPGFGVAAAFVGLCTGLLTVAVASDLRALIPGPRLGLHVGLATGAAYFIANLPPVFHGGPVVQSVVPSIACFVACGALLLRASTVQAVDEPRLRPLTSSDSRPLGFATLVLAFMALVWLDSAAFRIVQETASLRHATWGPGASTLVQGTTHLVAAICAGWLIDRGLLRSLLLATFVLFTAAFAFITAGSALASAAGPLYAVGISIYSTALVLAPSLGAEGPGLVPRRWRAAILYACAGWVGSALGIGMAQDLHRIPTAFTAVAGCVLLAGIVMGHVDRLRVAFARIGPAIVLSIAGLGIAVRPPVTEDAVATDPVARGRRVYIAEGCIQCHSQYVRQGADEIAWGPSRRDQLEERPPLLGTRRLGPDLLNVANRRSAAWERVHLIDPAVVSPSSRMPSYAHLFHDGETRGDDLVAYLTSLGRDTIGLRAALTRTVAMPADATQASPVLGRRVFAASCAPCHGSRGQGDGPIAAAVASPFLDLRMPGLPRCERVTGDELQDLERLIRFGSCDAMPGHELLTDRELVSVAAFVRDLRAGVSR